MGFFSDLAGSFTGSTAKKAINKGYRDSQAHLATGYDRASTGYQTAQSRLDPYVSSGRVGQDMYEATLGLRGADARNEAQDLYYSDPNQERIAALTQRGLARRYNAGGAANSGAHITASTNAFLQDYGNWQNRLAGVGQQGQQAASQQASNDMTFGTLGYQYGSDQAGNSINRANATAAASNVLAQNVLGLGGLVLGGFTPGRTGTTPFGNMMSGLGQAGTGVANYFRPQATVPLGRVPDPYAV